MIEQSQIQEILSDILESPEFKDSQRYRELLQYLVGESIAGRSPKETTIGMRIFGKDASFNSKDDATVRVYINNLRKKLEHYYHTTEKQYSYKLCIPVGHYKVEFVPAQEKKTLGAKTSRALTVTIIASLVVLAFLLGLFSGRFLPVDRSTPAVPNPIWDEFVQPNGRPTLFVLGDYFFLRDQNSPVSAYYRTITINTLEDYQQTIRNDPGFAARYKPNSFTYIRPSAPSGIARILPILQNSPGGYSIKLASQFTDNDFKTHNIIFIGALKTMHSFYRFLHTFNIEYQPRPEYITILGGTGDSLRRYFIGDQRAETYIKDYSVIVKGAGPEGSTILLLLGFQETGVNAATHIACDPSLFDAIKEKFPATTLAPRYFTLVVNTEGLTNAIFNYDMREFLPIKPLHDLSNLGRSDSAIVKRP